MQTTRTMVAPEGRQSAPEIDPHELQARVDGILNRRPCVGLAVGVVRGGRLEFFHGHGLADIDSHTPITEDTIFRIASITKTFTAIAVMQLWEQGLVDLDAPANDYLRPYRLIRARPDFRPATVRQLLTHTAGIPEELHPTDALKPDFGESFRLDQRLPRLAEYYRGGIRLEAEPGTRFVYSDHGFATLGQIVEDVSGEPFDRYLREQVFEPLGMADTDLLRPERVTSRLATGYAVGSAGAKAVTDRAWVTAGASSIYSTPRDMSRYLAALLGGGANRHGSILRPATLATMFEPHYQPDPRIPGIGLAFSRFDLGGHLAVEHGGILPGFNSQIFLAPDDGVGVMAFTNGARRAMLWLPAEVSRLLGELLGVPAGVVRTDLPQHPETWAELCGRYRLPARWTDLRLRAMTGLGAEVFVRGGQLTLRGLSPIPALYRGFVLHPDDERDPDVFRIDLSEFGIGTSRVVFSRGPDGAAKRVSLEIFPVSLEKQRPNPNRRVWAGMASGALGIVAGIVAVRGRRTTGRRHAGRRRRAIRLPART